MNRDNIGSFIEDRKEDFIKANDMIWEFAELGLEEHKSSEYLSNLLNEEEFEVKRNLAGMPTAFSASYGSGKPIIAILGEFDALPGLSQKASTYEKEEVVNGGNGHGCGHNTLGAGSLAASVAVKEYLKKNQISGTVRYYGCPAEENGSGKTYMVRDGIFDDVDIALSWHPMDTNNVIGIRTQACMSAYFRFKGVSAHAAVSPHLGRSALDAMELMNVGANYLREHISKDALLHYAITDGGGKAPNVVQDKSEVYYFVRDSKTKDMFDVYDRLCDVAKGAALMTGTEVEIEFIEGLSDYIPNRTLGELMSRNFSEVGSPKFDNDDHKLAEKFKTTFTDQEIMNTLGQIRMFAGEEVARSLEDKSVCDYVSPYIHLDMHMPGSTDVGDVSYVVPTAQLTTACCALATTGHTWQFTAQMCSPLAHKGMLTAAKVMALTAVDIINTPDITEKAKTELFNQTKGIYNCPLPKDSKPIK